MSQYETHVVYLAKKLGETIQYLHQLGIVVSDFDANNIMMNQTDELNPQFVNSFNFKFVGP